jgi:hypothetical protein
MKELNDQPTCPPPPHGTDRWGDPVFGDHITTGSYVFMPQPGQEAGERDVFQVAFIGGRPDARDELVAFGWLCDAATGEWEPYWQSVGPGSVATVRSVDAVAVEAQQQPQPEAPPESCAHCGEPVRCITGTLAEWWVHTPGGNTVCNPEHAGDSPRATPEPAAGVRQDGAQPS